MSQPSSDHDLRTCLNSMSDTELRNMFTNSTVEKESQKKKDGSNRPLTLDELLKSPLSNIFELRVGQANILRSAGNDTFKKGNIELAVRLYERALMHCSMDDDSMSQESKKLKQQMFAARDPIHLNLARCYLKEKRFRDSVTSAKSVMRGHSEDEELDVPIGLKFKALVILARGYIELGEYGDAECAVKTAQSQYEAITGSAAQDISNIDATLSVLPQLRQSIKIRIIQDRITQRAQWRGALSSSPNPATAVSSSSPSRPYQNLALLGTILAAVTVAIAYKYLFQ